MNGPPKAKKQTRLATNYSFDSQIESKKMLLCFCLFQCVWKEGKKLRKTFSTSPFRNIRGLCFNEMFQQRNDSKHTFEILTYLGKKKILVCIKQFVFHFMLCSLLSSLIIVDRSILLDHFIKHKPLISEEYYVAVTLTQLSLYILDYLTSQKMSKHNVPINVSWILNISELEKKCAL